MPPAAETLQSLVSRAWGVDVSFCYWLLITAGVLTPLLWHGTPKDLKWVGGKCNKCEKNLRVTIRKEQN